MESWISGLALHGYSILFAAVFLEAIGLPLPAALALLIAGGASARGSLQGSYALGGALLAMVAGDTLMFVLGRYTGWWLLGVLCHFAEPRIVHPAFGGFLLSPWARAARRCKVHSWDQHHGAAARRLHEHASPAVPRAGSGRCRALHRLILCGWLPLQRRARSDH